MPDAESCHITPRKVAPAVGSTKQQADPNLESVVTLVRVPEPLIRVY